MSLTERPDLLNVSRRLYYFYATFAAIVGLVGLFLAVQSVGFNPMVLMGNLSAFLNALGYSILLAGVAGTLTISANNPTGALFRLVAVFAGALALLNIATPETFIHLSLFVLIGMVLLAQVAPDWRSIITLLGIYLVALAFVVGLPGSFGIPDWPFEYLLNDPTSATPIALLTLLRVAGVFGLIIALVSGIFRRTEQGEGLPLGFLLTVGSTAIVAISLVIVVSVMLGLLQNETTNQVGRQFVVDARLEGENYLRQLESSFDRLTSYGISAPIAVPVAELNRLIADEEFGSAEAVAYTDLIASDVTLFLRNNSEFAQLRIASPFGQLLYSTIPGDDFEFDYTSQVWWLQGFNNGAGALYFGPSYTRADGRVVFDVAMPVRQQGVFGVVGVIYTQFDPSAISTLDSTAFTVNKIIQIVDITPYINNAGPARVIAGPPGVEIGRALPTNIVTQIIESPFDWGVDANEDTGELYIHSHAYLNRDTTTVPLARQTEIVVLIEQPRAIALTAIGATVRPAITLSVLLLLGTVVLAALFTNLVLNPIRALIGVANEMVGGDLYLKAPTEGPQELATLARAFNTLTQNLADQVALLQVRVEERTRYLVASQDVAQVVNAILNPEALLDRVVELITERFDIYTASIYLLNSDQTHLELKSGTGELGRTLLAAGFSLPNDETNLLGRTVFARRAQLDQVSSNDPRYFEAGVLPNPHLDIEIALPLQIGGNILGVLVVQTLSGAALDLRDRDTITVLQTTADQIAVAIENASSYGLQRELSDENQRLLDLSRENVIKLERLTNQLSREGWQSYFQQHEAIEVQDMAPDSELHPPYQLHGIDEALRQQQVVQLQNENAAELAVPLRVRDTIIGALSLVDDDGNPQQWSDEEIGVVRAVAEQLSLAIENARLFDETNQRLSEQNWLYQVANAASSAATLDEALRRTAQNIRQRFPTAVVSMFLMQPDRRSLRLAVVEGYDLVPDLEVVLGEGVVGQVARTGQPMVLRDVRTSTHYIPSDSFASGAVLTVPLRIGEEVIGVLNCESDEIGLFGDNDRNLITTLASTLSAVVVNNQLLASEQRQRQIATRLKDIAERMAGTLREENLRDLLIDEVAEHLKPDQMTLFEWLPEENALVMDRRRSNNDGSRPNLFDHYQVGDAVSSIDRADLWDVYDTELPLLQIDQPENAPAIEHLVVPWRVGEVTTGVIEIYRTVVTEPIRPVDQQYIDGVVRQAANAIQLARIYDEQRQTAERLAELDRLKSEFLANMSHELRTPLNSIIGFSRVILKGIDGPINDMQEQDLRAIYNAGQHLLKLINDVLDLSKIEAGKMELAFEQVDLAETIHDVMSSTIRALVKDKPVELRQDIDLGLPLVHADRIRTRQVLINILGNAAKFTEEGHVLVRAFRVEMQTAEGHMRQMVQVDVTDTGPGIAPADQDKLFRSFSQVDSSPTRKTGGTGLGLALVKYMVDMHGGSVWVKSDLTQGATFSFTLPIDEDYLRKESQSPAAPPQVIATPAGTRPLTPIDPDAATSPALAERPYVLVVDNDEGLIGMYERYLRNTGFAVIGVTTPTAAINQVTRRTPSVILLEPALEQGDGWALLQQLKENATTVHVPVIICSLSGSEEQAATLGARYYLAKPILETDLTHAIEVVQKPAIGFDILLIDDKPEDLRLIRQALAQSRQLMVREAVGGLAGINAIYSRPPQAIIVDLVMPEIDGYNLIEAVKSNPQTRDIPIMVVTGAELTEADHQRLRRYGTRYFTKDIFRTDDKESVNEMLRELESLL